LLHGHPLVAGSATPAVDQPIVAMLFIPLPPAPHLTVNDADDLRRLTPADLFAIARKITSCTFIARSTAA